MSAVKNFKAARNIPNPDIRSAWNFRPWSYGFMRPLHCIPHSITVNNTLQSILDIFIPANTWADFKRLIIWADIGFNQNAPPHPGGRMYGEAQQIQGLGVQPRGGVNPIANYGGTNRYVIQRQYQFETGGTVYEENWDIQGNTMFTAAVGSDHRIPINIAALFDNTVDAYLSLYLGCNFAGSNDTAFIHTAQAYIQAPLNLNRLPQ